MWFWYLGGKGKKATWIAIGTIIPTITLFILLGSFVWCMRRRNKGNSEFFQRLFYLFTSTFYIKTRKKIWRFASNSYSLYKIVM